MCCCTKKLISEAIVYLADVLRDQSEAWRLEVFPPPSMPLGFGKTENVGERKDQNMWFEQIQQSFLDLPPATGRDADIVKGVFTVTVGEAVILQEDVAYDLSTRACRGPSSMFEILKNSPYDISLKFLDDDDNASAEVTATLTATDTLPPNAPTGFGATANIGEREVADAPPTEPTEPAPEPPADGT